MKIVKLDRRYSAVRFGFTHMLKFNSWDTESRAVELILNETYKTATYGDMYAPFYGRFLRTNNTTGQKPYCIYLRTEADISLILLKTLYCSNIKV